MNFIQEAVCNDVLRPPADATNEQCRPLPVFRTAFADSTPCVISFWKPTPQELEKLTRGESIALCVIGHTHPPLLMAAFSDLIQPT